jgi:type II secretory pathway pseudopilin PulG
MKTLMRSASRLKAARARAVDSTDVDPEARPDDHGVSGIIELVIVLVILGVLTAILLPTFLGTTTQAKNRSAQSDLTNAVTSTSTYYGLNASFPTGVAGASVMKSYLNSSEPELTFVASSTATGSIAALHNVLVIPISANQVVLAALSSGGNCYYASINMGSASGSGATSGTQYVQSGTNGTCSATAPTSGWATTMPS